MEPRGARSRLRHDSCARHISVGRRSAIPQRALYDLGQATMSIMLAAADLGIGSGHTAVTDQDASARSSGFRTTGSARTSSRSVTPPTDHSPRLRGQTADCSTRSSIGAAVTGRPTGVRAGYRSLWSTGDVGWLPASKRVTEGNVANVPRYEQT